MKRMWSKNELKSVIQNQVSSGDLKDVKVFEEIVDKNGHKRFQTLEGTISTQEGITNVFSKALLSGSHLLIVCAFNVTNATALTSGSLCEYELPQWILDEIIPNPAGFIDGKNTSGIANDGTSQTIYTQLTKQTGKIVINKGQLTLTADRYFRITYDIAIE